MKVVIQRVKKASVEIENVENRYIEQGLVVLLGIEHRDENCDVQWLVNKVLQIRIFDDQNGVMNKSVIDIEGQIMVISQFTLMASTKKGNRPSYIRAASHVHAIPLYNHFIELIETALPGKISNGEFGADMKVSLVNDGPVTIIIDSQNKE